MQLYGETNFIVLESSDSPGGLCRSSSINGHTLDIGGGHFLCSKYQEVYDFIFSHISKDNFNYYERVSKIKIEDNIIDYPIESNIWQLPVQKQIDYLISAIQNGESIRPDDLPTDYENWIRWKLGNKITDNYMIPYNRKLWGIPPHEMDIDWLYKIPRLDINEIVLSCIEKRSLRDKMPSHAGFYYPKKGGFQAIFDAIYEKVKNKVILDEKVDKLVYNNSRWTINDAYDAQYVINTAPWPLLYDALGTPDFLKQDFKKLQFNSIVVSLYEHEYENNWHWVYIPDEEAKHHREFYIRNFAADSKDTGVYFETNINRWSNSNIAKKSEYQPIYEYINDVAYPIPVKGHSKAITSILSYYKEKNLIGLGRWGQWQYLNADVCIYNAIVTAQDIVQQIAGKA